MTAADQPQLHTISLHVRNRPGVLVRIAQVFARRGYNIESLVVCPGQTVGFSRMTITCSGDPQILEQIIKQQAKLVDVVHATDHTGQDIIDTEIALIKIHVALEERTALLQIVEHYRAKVVDYGPDSMILRVSGSSDKINACVGLLRRWEILELMRSGKLVMMRGTDET